MEQIKMIRFPELPQLAKIAALLLLFLLVPFVPPSLRAPCLYLLFNALVVALGIQAGFISVSGLRDEKESPPPSSTPGAASTSLQTKPSNSAASVTNADHLVSGTAVTSSMPPKAAILELRELKPTDHAAIKGVVGAAKKLKEKIKKCPSRASIFFIGSVDADDGEVVDATVKEEREEEEKVWKDAGELMTKQELFTKAEAFIGNFYKQLKMQREESWNKLQDLYNYHNHYKAKAF